MKRRLLDVETDLLPGERLADWHRRVHPCKARRRKRRAIIRRHRPHTRPIGEPGR